uniref:Uncharacterized protein n=1 Tax=Arundo donax TaxID=35708 RepID=A0A0A9EWS6_ARUDO
MAGVKPDSHGE